jgi:Isocitrate/isopropylmalate dehydrogenase
MGPERAASPGRRIRIAVLPGDGIGPAVVGAAVTVMNRAANRNGLDLVLDELPCGLSALRVHRSTLPSETLEALVDYDGWLLGPVSTHLYDPTDPRQPNPSGYLRKTYNLFANIRPARAVAGIGLGRGLDVVIVRENTEGFYADRNLLDGNGEFRPTENVVLSLRVITLEASLRVARLAFRLAENRPRRRLTVAHKANVLRRGDGLFLEACARVHGSFPDVIMDERHVDALATELITHPASFDVIVTTNMFGDILSNEAAGLTGGLGIAPSLNAGDDRAMAQAVHGSAPDIADQGIADPIAEVRSGAMLLRWLGQRAAATPLIQTATDIEAAVDTVLAAGSALTPDLGGTSSTADVTQAILDAIGAEGPASR